MKIKISKFVPKFYSENGEDYLIIQNNFNEDEASNEIFTNIITESFSDKLLSSNLTTAIKKLVKESRIGAITVAAQHPKGYAVETRSMNHNSDKGLFVDTEWYAEYFNNSSKISKAKWFWLERSNPKPTDIINLSSHTIHPDIGKITQDSFCEGSLEGLIDEIISKNN